MAEESSPTEDLVLEPISIKDIKWNSFAPTDGHNSLDHLDHPDGNQVKYFSTGMDAGSKRKRTTSSPSLTHHKYAVHWRQALLKAKCHTDSWGKFHLADHPTEKALRHRFNALKKEWIVDEVNVKMQMESFAHGSMRQCYRIKKLSNFSHNQDWGRDSNNAVAKQYISPVKRNIYFEEVKLQMDAKLWAEEYNRHHPPKKVDICLMAVLEFVDRPNCPLYHVENFIEGKYVKYNSNSGFVLDDEAHRQTPQAFSHLTFERSGHQLVVVDIQGVGDLYTDPQIHTAAGKEYGDGNLGTRGMALFFHTHVCNSICVNMGLTPFDLAASELESLSAGSFQSSAPSTVSRGNEELCISPACFQRNYLHEFVRARSSSSLGSCSSLTESLGEWSVGDIEEDERDANEFDSALFMRSRIQSVGNDRKPPSMSRSPPALINGGGESQNCNPSRRQRMISETGSVNDEADHLAFREWAEKNARPSCVMAEVESRKKWDSGSQALTGGSVLGRIHLDLAKYHEMDRFTKADSDGYDHVAALYHLRHAADCGDLEAIITLARIALQLPNDVLPDITLEPSLENTDMGLDFMQLAALAGDRGAIIVLAKAYDSGEGLGSRSRSWVKAASWYTSAIGTESSDEDGHYDGTMDNPTYQLLARLAEMYRDGGYELQVDAAKAAELFTQAAESAMTAMKGRLANKFYCLAEELNGLVDE